MVSTVISRWLTMSCKRICSCLPRYSLAISNFSQLDSYDPYYRSGLLSVASVTFMKCSKRVASDSHVDTKPCTKGAYPVDTPPNFSQMKVYSYVVHEFDLLARDIKDSCTITMIAFAPGYIREQEGEWYNRVSSPYKDLHNMMTDGFKLSYEVVNLRGRTFRLCFLGFSYQGAECSFYYSRKQLSLKLFFRSCFFFLLLLCGNASSIKRSCGNLVTECGKFQLDIVRFRIYVFKYPIEKIAIPL